MAELLQELARHRGRRPFDDLRRPGLVVLDAQLLFCDPGSPAFVRAWPDAAPRVARLAAAFLEANLPVVFTRHCHPADDAGGLIARFFGRLQRAHDPLVALLPELEPLWARAAVVDKARHSAFSQQRVAQLLAGCDSVALCGVQTPLCVLASAVDAARVGLTPLVVADACAARDADDHRAALRSLACGHAHICSAAELLGHLASPGSSA